MMIEIILSGGLGNQMFEYACARAKHLDVGGDFCINIGLLENDQSGRKYSLDCFNIFSNAKVYKKRRRIIRLAGGLSDFSGVLIYNLFSLFGIYVWRKRVYRDFQCLNSCNYLYGYFQSEKYFLKYSKIIRKELRCNIPTSQKNLEYLRKIRTCTSICIHVRRGDYIAEGLVICNLDYYQKAIGIIKKNVKDAVFFVFSDDILWTKNNLNIPNAIYIDNDNKDYEEMELMYNCKHFIISNSSFSWWAQYLSVNEEKVVIAPKYWVPKDKSKNDIYMSEWILI